MHILTLHHPNAAISATGIHKNPWVRKRLFINSELGAGFRGEAVEGNLFAAVERNEQELPRDNLVLEAKSPCYSGKPTHPATPPGAAGRRPTGGQGSGSRTAGLTPNLVLGCNKPKHINPDKFMAIHLISRFANED